MRWWQILLCCLVAWLAGYAQGEWRGWKQWGAGRQQLKKT